MNIYKKKISKSNLVLIFFIFLALIFYFAINRLQKEKEFALQPISINLLTSVHPKLSWSFKPVKPKIIVHPGDVVTVEYIVENLSEKSSVIEKKIATKLFGYSILYLFMIFTFILIDKVI